MVKSMTKDQVINELQYVIHAAEYTDASYKEIDIEVIKAALQLIKEQDNTLKAYGIYLKDKIYILNKDEIINYYQKNWNQDLYCEFRYGVEPQYCSCIDIYQWLDEEDYQCYHHKYGKTWRCWSRKPDLQLMKETVWED